MAHEVFISHSHKDKQMADAICHYLEHKKIKCWIAPRDVMPGTNFAGEIVEAIPKSKIMLLIFSANSNSSKQVLREIELAINNDLLVIPVRIEDIMPTGSMKYYLSTTNWIDIIDEEIEKKISKIVDIIQGVTDVLDNNEIPARKAQKTTASQTSNGKPKPLTKKKVSTKKLIILLSSIVLVVAVGLTLFLMRDTIFESKKDENEAIEITAAADSELDLSMVVKIEDETLRKCILTTLDDMGELIEGDITAADMLKLEYLKIVSKSELENLKELFSSDTETFNSVTSGVISTEDTIESLEGLQYAQNIKVLNISGKEIRDLYPLEDLVNLETLFLANNKISNIAALKKMSDLRWLILSNNLISDVSPLEGLTGLKDLSLGSNLIEDISSLEGLSNLNNLMLDSNNVNDFSILASMIYLDGLVLSSNNISDISILSSMRKIKQLDFSNNNISDISVLSKLDDLVSLDFNNNDISDISVLSTLDNLISLDLGSNEISDINILKGSQYLKSLIINNNNINNIDVLLDMESLKTVNLSYNPIWNFEIIEQLQTLDKLIIDLATYDYNPFTMNRLKENGCEIQIQREIVDVETQEETLEKTLKYSPEDFDLDPNMVVKIDDNALRDAILTTLEMQGTPVNDSITVADMFNLSELYIAFLEDFSGTLALLPNAGWDLQDKFVYTDEEPGIGSLNGLQYARNLKVLILAVRCTIENYDLLSKLESLEMLWVHGMEKFNPISKLENLQYLTINGGWIDNLRLRPIDEIRTLTHLTFTGNYLGADLSVLKNLILESFVIAGSFGYDLSPLEGTRILNNCKYFSAAGGESYNDRHVTNIDFLSGAQNLILLNLADNKIKDISILTNLINLKELYLDGNNIEDINILLQLPNLELLTIDGTNENISIVSQITNLQHLYVSGDNVSDISALLELNELRALHLDIDTYNNDQETVDKLKAKGCKVFVYGLSVYNDTYYHLSKNISEFVQGEN